MKIIPALYLLNGNCVSHYKGESEQVTILSKDPLCAARDFEREGAMIIHIVDLDGRNSALAALIAEKTSLEVQYADGITSLEMMRELLEKGVKRVSLNQDSEHLLSSALAAFSPEAVIFTIRAQREAVEGNAEIGVIDYGKKLEQQGVTNLIFRDTKAEGTLHPNFDEVDLLVTSTSMKIYAFGGIGKISDVKILAKVGCAGAIISRAFFTRALSLRECIEQFSS